MTAPRPAAAPALPASAAPPGQAGPAAAAGGGPHLSPAEFRALAARVRALTGIVLREHKRQMLQGRLARRLRALGLSDFAAYLALLDRPEGAAEQGALISAITTNLTAFFRERHHFTHLEAEVIRPAMARGARRFRVWSAGCSTGEEPYSVQMTMLAAGGLARDWDYRLLATDLDGDVLAQAAAGRYAADRLAPLPRALVARAFERHPDGSATVRPALRAAVSFRQLNLLGDWPLRGPFDAIFCRNVLIYFDAPAKQAIVGRLAALLAPEGVLYLGHSESLLGDHPALSAVGRTTYRRRP
jgi:chemotaxis protein methyltransferase CheR